LGALASLAMTYMVAYGCYTFVRSSEERRRIIAEFRKHPFSCFITALAVLSMLTFFWGLVIPRLGMLPVMDLRLWQFAGICAAALFVPTIVADDRRRRRR
jgi:hypothetical protein